MNKLQKIILPIVILAAVFAAAGGAFFLSGKGGEGRRPEKSYEDYLGSAEYYYNDSKYQQALSCYRSALELKENDLEALRGEGKTLRALSYDHDAIEVYESICALDGCDTEDVVSLISLQIQAKELEKAKQTALDYKDKDTTGQIEELLSHMNVEIPSLSVSSGSYNDYQLLYVTDENVQDTVYYTLDGSEPTVGGEVLSEGIVLSAPTNHVRLAAASYLGYMSDVVDLDVSITKAVEKIDSRSGLIYDIAREVFNKNWDDDLYNYELAQVTELYCIGYNIQTAPLQNVKLYSERYSIGNSTSYISEYERDVDLEFLKYMPYLRKLSICYFKGLDITGIENGQSLVELALINDGLTGIEKLSGLKKLERLSLGWNEINDISPVSGLHSLKSLALWSNQVNDISEVSGLTELEYFDVSDNGISDISSVKNLKKLTELWVYRNNISDMSPISECTSLNKLMQSDNPGSGKGVSDEVIMGLRETDWEAR